MRRRPTRSLSSGAVATNRLRKRRGRAIRTVARIRFGAERLTGRGPGPGRARDHGRMADPAAPAGLGAWPGRPRTARVSGRPAAAIPHGHAGRRPPRGRSRRSRSDPVHGQRAVVMFLSSQTRRSIMKSGKAWCLALGFFLGASLSPAARAQEQDQQNETGNFVAQKSQDQNGSGSNAKSGQNSEATRYRRQQQQGRRGRAEWRTVSKEKAQKQSDKRLDNDQQALSQWWAYPTGRAKTSKDSAGNLSVERSPGLDSRQPGHSLSSISPRPTIRCGNT